MEAFFVIVIILQRRKKNRKKEKRKPLPRWRPVVSRFLRYFLLLKSKHVLKNIARPAGPDLVLHIKADT
jgi:hypothetical protein